MSYVVSGCVAAAVFTKSGAISQSNWKKMVILERRRGALEV